MWFTSDLRAIENLGIGVCMYSFRVYGSWLKMEVSKKYNKALTNSRKQW